MSKHHNEFEEAKRIRDWSKHADDYDLDVVGSQVPQPAAETYAESNRRVFAEFGGQERVFWPRLLHGRVPQGLCD